MRKDMQQAKTGLRLPAAAVMAVLAQAAGIIVWATQLDARVADIEQKSVNEAKLSEQFARLDERLDHMRQDIGEIKNELNHLADRLMRP